MSQHMFQNFKIMFIRVITTASFIFSAFLANAQMQKSGSELFYGRYQGKTGQQTEACANLIRNEKQVYGNVYLHNPSSENTTQRTGINVSGNMIGDSVTLNELGNNTAIFTGILNPDALSGVYLTPENETIDFLLKVDYPEGSIPLDVSYLHSELELMPGKTDTPEATIELTLLYPLTYSTNPAISDSVLKKIQLEFFGSGQQPNSPDTMLLAYENEYYQNFRKQNQQWKETGGHSFSWEKMINTSVLYNSDYLLCMEFERYVFTGGTHGMSNIAYESINLLDGTSFTFENVFLPDSDSLLTQMLTAQLKSNRKLTVDGSLKQDGYFVDNLTPNHNMFINASGIGFTYNPYEIAPYSYGITQVHLPWEAIKSLLRTNTPIFALSAQ